MIDFDSSGVEYAYDGKVCVSRSIRRPCRVHELRRSISKMGAKVIVLP